MPVHRTLARECRFEIERIKKSRFLGAARPVDSAEDAQAFIAQIRREESDARHHCFAWRLLGGDARAWDDGEPGGTAGQPILTRIDGLGLRGVVVVVTRYFGGTKLGKGGLIRAYGAAAAATLATGEIIEVHETRAVALCFDYRDQGSVDAILHGLRLRPSARDYGERITLEIPVPIELVSSLGEALRERTAGRIQLAEDD